MHCTPHGKFLYMHAIHFRVPCQFGLPHSAAEVDLYAAALPGMAFRAALPWRERVHGCWLI